MKVDTSLITPDFYSEDENILKSIQNKFRDRISLKNNFDLDSIKTVAGVDLAYWKKADTEKAVCCIVVIDYKTGEILERKHFSDEINFPYIAGYLSFREIPLILKTAELLEITPDVFFFDGNGYLHPRNMGIATFSSFFLNKPSIGIAKKYYKINNTEFIMPENTYGAYTDIVIEDKVYGRVLRTVENVKPVFLSCGNYIDIDTAMKLTLNLTNEKKGSRIPIPTWIADAETKFMREKLIFK